MDLDPQLVEFLNLLQEYIDTHGHAIAQQGPDGALRPTDMILADFYGAWVSHGWDLPLDASRAMPEGRKP